MFGSYNLNKMPKKLFVANLDWSLTDSDLREAFSPYGEISDCFVVKDHETNKSRGFGFVTFTDTDAADSAIDNMNGASLNGRPLVVNEARERKPRQ